MRIINEPMAWYFRIWAAGCLPFSSLRRWPRHPARSTFPKNGNELCRFQTEYRQHQVRPVLHDRIPAHDRRQRCDRVALLRGYRGPFWIRSRCSTGLFRRQVLVMIFLFIWCAPASRVRYDQLMKSADVS